MHAIEKLKRQFFDETDHQEKAKLKVQIDEQLGECLAGSKKSLGYQVNFDFEIFFSEVFQQKGGFDVVIANPPYVRQEAIKQLKPILKNSFECFTGTADLYVYFFERGVRLLCPAGTLTYISSNSFLNSAFGENLRRFLSANTRIRQIIDFAETKVFEAITEPCVICLSQGTTPDHTAKFLKWDQCTPPERITDIFQTSSQPIFQRELKPDGWQLESPAVLRLLEKLRRSGNPLSERVNGRFYRGVLTGLNEAFAVDRATRDQLINEHKSSAEILKPFLRGRDLKRWRPEFAEQYLIKIESSENKNHPWSGRSEKDAEAIFIKTYPAIFRHFQSLLDTKLDEPDSRGCRNKLEQLQRRDDQGKYFWELRSCTYWQEFEQPKIVYQEINRTDCFALDDSGGYVNNKLFMLPSAPSFWLGLFNSLLGGWYLHSLTGVPFGGFLALQWPIMKTFPIPAATPEKQEPIVSLVDRILALKSRDASANVADLEREIDPMVYELYELTHEEIAVVEESVIRR